jgi:hypothetical protein
LSKRVAAGANAGGPGAAAQAGAAARRAAGATRRGPGGASGPSGAQALERAEAGGSRRSWLGRRGPRSERRHVLAVRWWAKRECVGAVWAAPGRGATKANVERGRTVARQDKRARRGLAVAQVRGARPARGAAAQEEEEQCRLERSR